MTQAQQVTGQAFQAGRVNAGHSAASNTGGNPAGHASTADDLELSAAMNRYDALGDEPPQFNIARNDDAYRSDGAHTIERHGPDVALRRAPNVRTVEGRIYGDDPWRSSENRSFKWTDHTTMNQEVNRYVQENWETIRSDLALTG